MSTPARFIRLARLFESYVRFVWPLHRPLVLSRLSKRCRVCAASERMSALSPTGLCEACEAPPAPRPETPIRNPEDARRLAGILEQHQNAGPLQFDALGLFSGGKDSTYMLHRIRSDFPRLRILAFTIDNGFMSPVAKQNVEKIVSKLGLDHVFVRPEASFHRKLFRYCLTHLNADGGYGTMDFSDGEFMLDTARAMAAEKRIPLILCGYSKYQVQNGLRLDSFESPRESECSNRVETAGLRIADIFSEEEQRRWWHADSWPKEQIARLLFPLHAWDLEEADIKAKVAEWGLLTEKEYSPIVTNHQLIPLIGVVDVHRFGYSSFEREFCRMIREGKADRTAWQPTFEFLEYCAKTGLFIRPLVAELLAQLDLTWEDVGVKFT
jgi:hypothetical protein